MEMIVCRTSLAYAVVGKTLELEKWYVISGKPELNVVAYAAIRHKMRSLAGKRNAK
jgi:hypothetical protein